MISKLETLLCAVHCGLGDKCLVLQQFFVGECHSAAVWKCFDPVLTRAFSSRRRGRLKLVPATIFVTLFKVRGQPFCAAYSLSLRTVLFRVDPGLKWSGS